ncbi:MAG: AraC family transcriptional regulator [Chloroflexota bacterium]
MLVHPPAQETAKFWVAPDIGQLELLKATYIKHTFPRHTHDAYVIGIVERGVQAFYYRGANHVAPAGSIIVINPDEVHTGYAAHETGWSYRTLYPTVELMQRTANDTTNDSGLIPLFPVPIIHDPLMAKNLRQLHITLETSPSALKRESLFIETLTHFVQRHAQSRPDKTKLGAEHYAVRQIQDYLAQHYADNITVDQLARLVNLSPFYLTRIFRQATGLPPHTFLTQLRINQAKRLLATEQSIVDVAVQTGFVDQSHLTRHFKRFVGTTPGQYLSSLR